MTARLSVIRGGTPDQSADRRIEPCHDAVNGGTKAAVEAFTRVFAKELRGWEITINGLTTGPIATELYFYGKS